MVEILTVVRETGLVKGGNNHGVEGSLPRRVRSAIHEFVRPDLDLPKGQHGGGVTVNLKSPLGIDSNRSGNKSMSDYLREREAGRAGIPISDYLRNRSKSGG